MAHPKTLGASIDKLYRVRDQIAAEKARVAELTKPLDKLKGQEKELVEHVTELLKREKVTGSHGKLAKVSLTKKQQPALKNRRALAEFIVEHEAYELIGSVSTPAWREYLENEEFGKVPGIEKFTQVRLSINKL